MDKWEYRNIYLTWLELKDSQGKKYYEWVAQYMEGTSAEGLVEGLNEILNRAGAEGWELVNIVSEYSNPVNSNGGNSTTGFRAFFKRKL